MASAQNIALISLAVGLAGIAIVGLTVPPLWRKVNGLARQGNTTVAEVSDLQGKISELDETTTVIGTAIQNFVNKQKQGTVTDDDLAHMDKIIAALKGDVTLLSPDVAQPVSEPTAPVESAPTETEPALA